MLEVFPTAAFPLLGVGQASDCCPCPPRRVASITAAAFRAGLGLQALIAAAVEAPLETGGDTFWNVPGRRSVKGFYQFEFHVLTSISSKIRRDVQDTSVRSSVSGNVRREDLQEALATPTPQFLMMINGAHNRDMRSYNASIECSHHLWLNILLLDLVTYK